MRYFCPLSCPLSCHRWSNSFNICEYGLCHKFHDFLFGSRTIWGFNLSDGVIYLKANIQCLKTMVHVQRAQAHFQFQVVPLLLSVLFQLATPQVTLSAHPPSSPTSVCSVVDNWGLTSRHLGSLKKRYK